MALGGESMHGASDANLVGLDAKIPGGLYDSESLSPGQQAEIL
jgi:hypothetical protein